MSHNISGVIKSIQKIMRNDRGLNGDAQRIEQLGWMIFLKIFDDKDLEIELIKDDIYHQFLVIYNGEIGLKMMKELQEMTFRFY